jgi:hypothetical protein
MSKLQFAAVHARLAALEQRTFGYVRHRWSKRQLAEHEGVTPRTVDRGVVRGIYAQPEIENGRLYWWSDSYRRVPGAVDTAAMRAARNPRLRVRPMGVEQIPK